ncbi:MAG: 4-hydroxy-tetrahydrodipicolinate synthase [Burkholderiales bacterium]|jgi:4-hydroxy-tetrahydrodipicolinate synthase|nr:4-hydroxy-tetrahydrodipicolinate synthase [Burkholderiales bacterium]
MITGSLVALVTPMFEDGSIDWDSYRKLVQWHIAEGTDAIVAVGTTGESPTVDVEEHGELIKVAVEEAAGRLPIIAGTGGNSTTEAIELTAYAKQVGAAASLQVVPYYNKPTQEGMYQHFRKVAESVDLPVVLYNVPGRTVADMSNETVLRLAQVSGVVGIKDATGDLHRGAWLVRNAPADFAVYSGDDPTAVNLILMGGKGNISVTANVAPKAMAKLCALALAGNSKEAYALNMKLLPLHRDLFCQANPIPVKWALAEMQKMASGIRLPLVKLEAQYQAVVRDALRECEIL